MKDTTVTITYHRVWLCIVLAVAVIAGHLATSWDRIFTAILVYWLFNAGVTMAELRGRLTR